MTSRDLKKENQYRRVKTRPEGRPVEIVTLKNGRSVGAYGVRRKGNTWEYLIDLTQQRNPRVLDWINNDKILSIEAWSVEGQVKLDKLNSVDKEVAKVEQKKVVKSSQAALQFSATKMVFSIQYKNKTEKIMTDFNGVIIGIKNKSKDNTSITDYLKVLTNKYGSNNISYTYVLQ